MKKLIFLGILSVFSVHAGFKRDALHEYLRPIYDLYHSKKSDYYLAIPKPLSDWQIDDNQKTDKLIVSYKNIPFFSVVAHPRKLDIDCNKHHMYKGRLLKIAKSIAQNIKKGLQIERAIFKKEHDDIYYIFIEGSVNGKKSYHFITSSEYQWFDLFTDVDEKYPECLEQKLCTFFMGFAEDFYDEDEEEEEDEEDEPYDAADLFFKMFILDLYAKRCF